MQTLWSKGDERATTPELRTSARVGDEATSSLLSRLLSGADAKSFINLPDSEGNTTLHDAVWNGDREVAEELLKEKWNPDIPDYNDS
jgi:ankyrin repeat protein